MAEDIFRLNIIELHDTLNMYDPVIIYLQGVMLQGCSGLNIQQDTNFNDVNERYRQSDDHSLHETIKQNSTFRAEVLCRFSPIFTSSFQVAK